MTLKQMAEGAVKAVESLPTIEEFVENIKLIFEEIRKRNE